ncbi:unnamed protein product [Anisakis simplex]|uniref:Uncharacterized protein n=1 Tax=Anisakis simplex TaxID=6269 RepID=A0A3P6QCR8_ANISI|nr:unnamed protein product [Anisakis simplex]
MKVAKMHGHLNSDIWSDKGKFDKFIAENHVRFLILWVGVVDFTHFCER